MFTFIYYNNLRTRARIYQASKNFLKNTAKNWLHLKVSYQ